MEKLYASIAIKILTGSCTDSPFDDTTTTAECGTESAVEFESDASAVSAIASNDAKPAGSDVQRCFQTWTSTTSGICSSDHFYGRTLAFESATINSDSIIWCSMAATLRASSSIGGSSGTYRIR